jgi:hypothetical protein
MYDDVFGGAHETKFCACAIHDMGAPGVVASDGRKGISFSWQFTRGHNEAS